MPPIDMTARERATLTRLARTAAPVTDIPCEDGDKLVSQGLAVRDSFRLQITAKGQLELLRQRYRGMPPPSLTQSPTDAFIERIEQRLKTGLRFDIMSGKGETEDGEDDERS